MIWVSSSGVLCLLRQVVGFLLTASLEPQSPSQEPLSRAASYFHDLIFSEICFQANTLQDLEVMLLKQCCLFLLVFYL